jgi:hypothetical protein
VHLFCTAESFGLGSGFLPESGAESCGFFGNLIVGFCVAFVQVQFPETPKTPQVTIGLGVDLIGDFRREWGALQDLLWLLISRFPVRFRGGSPT